MTMQLTSPLAVKSSLNFTADRNDGGRFSNTMPEKSRQNLVSVEVKITDARALAYKPTLENEGFALVSHPAGRADWSDKAWIDDEYVPSCMQLIKQLTGARDVVHLFIPRS